MNLRHATAQASASTEPTETRHATSTRLHGRYLFLARAVWLTLTVFTLCISILSLPDAFRSLHTACTGFACTAASGLLTTGDMQALQKIGLSLDSYASYWMALTIGIALVWLVVGVILAWRKSDDWMALLVALMLITVGATSITDYLLFVSSSTWWIPANVLYMLISLALLYTFALFPNGRPVPRWTVWVPLIYPAALLFYFVLSLILHLPGWSLYRGTLPINAIAWFGCEWVLILAQIYRYFRVSNQVERQQTKWVTFSLIVVLLADFGGAAFANISSVERAGFFFIIINTVGQSLYLALPFGIAIAMMRYRLYDIDVIINRAAVYSLLTAMLVLVYVGLVLLLEFLLRGIISQTNNIAIVVSTLAIYVLFQPLRHRIQRIIDRRFYRSKYDAARIIANFSATLRGEIDLNQLSEHLIAVVQETMQPTHVSLWLRAPERPENYRALHKK